VSIDALVSFQRRLLPSAEVWNLALARLGWNVAFAPGLDVRTASGFQRGLFCGRRTGAEMSFSDLTAKEIHQLGLGKASVDRAVQFSFLYELEGAFVMAAGYALCQTAGGLFFDPQAGRVVEPGFLRQQVLSAIKRAPSLKGREW
jgi:hypothetical protein